MRGILAEFASNFVIVADFVALILSLILVEFKLEFKEFSCENDEI